jgi:hypothetical protein
MPVLYWVSVVHYKGLASVSSCFTFANFPWCVRVVDVQQQEMSSCNFGKVGRMGICKDETRHRDMKGVLMISNSSKSNSTSITC